MTYAVAAGFLLIGMIVDRAIVRVRLLRCLREDLPTPIADQWYYLVPEDQAAYIAMADGPWGETP